MLDSDLKTIKKKKTMKTYKSIKLALLVIAATLGSCSDILELTPQTALDIPSAFDSPAHIELSVAGVYDAANSGFYAGGAVRGYPFGAAHVEQGDNRGEDVVNTQAFFLVTYSNTYDGVSANNDYHFQTLFALINRANVVLEGLGTAKVVAGLTQANIDAYKGECRFLRALAYHELLKHFSRPYSDNPNAAMGGMPLRLTAIKDIATADAGAAVGRSTVQETYTQILADLDYAESVLPTTRAANLKITRATKAAAIAMKTRIYQHMNNWAAVITEANKLVPAGTPATFPSLIGSHTLPANPFSAFGSAGSKSNTESIFSIENDATDNPGVNGSLPQMYNTSAVPTSGRALVAISPMIWNQDWWLATDVRKTATFVNINVEATNGGGKGGYFTKKYSDVTGQSDNAPFIRYAEVLLNLAEALQRQNLAAPVTRAFDLYNAVRSRSRGGADPLYDQISDFLTGTDLLIAILNERRIEFLCEGLRWGDIHRLAQDATPGVNTWGGGVPMKYSAGITNYRPFYTGTPSTNTTTLATAGNRHDALPYSSYKFLWPIPTSEIILNPTLAAQQNPGW
jgi:hypothetical protein